MNNCTLIIDGNWLLMSRVGMVLKDFDKRNHEEDLERASDNLVDFLAQSVNKIITYFEGNIDNVIMVQDGGSWRKDYPKPHLYTEEYKGNRKKSDNANWDYIWSALKKFCQNFHDNGLTCTQAYTIEGDDWIWFWTRKLNADGCNTIIWSSDCDLKQLVQRDKDTLRWTAWFNDKAGLVLHDCYDTSNMTEADLFFNFEATDPQINNLINNVRQRNGSVNYINPDSIRLQKIVCGDAGDNIKSLMRVTTKSGKTARVSEKEWEKVRESLNINSLEDLKTNRDVVIKQLHNLKRFTSNTDSTEDLNEMFEYNFHMVVLDEAYIPEKQKDIMIQQGGDYLVADMDYLRNNYAVLSSHSEKNTVEELFNELPY